MLNSFQPAQKARKKAKVLVYGDAGAGKTLFALSWPGVAMIDTEGGADLYGGRFDFQVLRTKSLTDIIRAIEEVKRDGGKSVQTLVIDPVTVVWQVLQEAGQQAAEARAARFKRDPADVALTQRDWGLIKRRLYAAMVDLVNLPVNVILTAHLKDITETRRDDRGNEVQVKVGEKEDAEKKTRYWCDIVVRLTVEKGEHVAYIEKDRSGIFRVGQRIPNLTYAHFAQMLAAHADGATIQQPGEDTAIRRDAAFLDVEDQPSTPTPNGHPPTHGLPTDWDALTDVVNEQLTMAARYTNSWHLRQAVAGQINEENAVKEGFKPLDGKTMTYPHKPENIQRVIDRALTHARAKLPTTTPAQAVPDYEPDNAEAETEFEFPF